MIDRKSWIEHNVFYKELYDVIQEIYRRHPTGGELHVVLDDFNCRDKNLKWAEQHLAEDRLTFVIPDDDRKLYLQCLSLLWSIENYAIRAEIIHEATKEFML